MCSFLKKINQRKMNRDGKPVFTSDHPNIFVRNLNHNVEVGTYVTYHHNNNYLYGRIVASSSATGINVRTITIIYLFLRYFHLNLRNVKTCYFYVNTFKIH